MKGRFSATALLLAAGMSTRLYPLTRRLPKCLLAVGDRTILDHLRRALQRVGVRDHLVVTGYRRKVLEKHLAGSARLVHNPLFDQGNNLLSLRCALPHLEGSFLVLHTDLLVHPRILRLVLEAEGPLVLALDRQLVPETMKARLRGEEVLEVGKHLSPEQMGGTFLGVARFDASLLPMLREVIPSLPEGTLRKGYFTELLPPLRSRGTVARAVWTEGLPWCEIDTREDLERARREVLPALENSLTTGED